MRRRSPSNDQRRCGADKNVWSLQKEAASAERWSRLHKQWTDEHGRA